jgi:hypothetical protein
MILGNLALRQPSVLSSTYSTLYARNAVDGNPKPGNSAEYCAHSLPQNNPWWRVDLGKSYIVDQVYIVGRRDCCYGRMTGAIIRVGK